MLIFTPFVCAMAFAGANRNVQVSTTSETRPDQTKVTDRHENRIIEGWRVLIDRSLLREPHKASGAMAIRMLTNQLYEIATRFPEARVRELRTVTIRLDRDHSLTNMQYHPSRKWLIDNGHEPSLAKQVHIPRAGRMVKLLRDYAQPSVVMHELAHAWHDQVVGFDYAPIRDAHLAFVESGKFDEVLSMSGRNRKHYALTNHKEYFAEMTEAWFGTNDFYPFVRAEVLQASPETADLMKAIWMRPEGYRD